MLSDVWDSQRIWYVNYTSALDAEIILEYSKLEITYIVQLGCQTVVYKRFYFSIYKLKTWKIKISEQFFGEIGSTIIEVGVETGSTKKNSTIINGQL